MLPIVYPIPHVIFMSDSKRPRIIWGAKGHAKVILDILEDQGVKVIHFSTMRHP